MRRVLLMGIAALLLSVPAQAQTTGPVGSHLAWDQDAPSLAVAQSYRYRATYDGGSLDVVAVTCSGAASPFVCRTAVPLPAGAHSVRAAAAVVENGQESEPVLSAVFNFTLTPLPPAAPRNLRLVPPPVGGA